jgi:replicative DNA helicase
MQYVDDVGGESYQAGEGILDLITRLKEFPEVGVPMYGSLINTVTRGARLKKFYLRSAPTGVGKSRTMVADACNIACNQIYDESFGWIKNGTSEPTLYITTEQELEELQTMMLAFLSNVDEDHILNGKYEGNEEDRVLKAASILSESPLYIEVLPDFSLKDVEDKIKKNIRDHDIKYCFHDYIHSSLKILEEITRRAGGVKLREDNILFMMSIRLKDLCNQYGIFIMSSTQLNGDYQTSETPDQNLLRGAKAIADKIDLGMILLPVKSEDLEKLEPILNNNTFDTPNLKLSVYKNRRGRYKGVYLWCKGDLGTCRVNPMFCTGYDYEIIGINDLKIITEEVGAF